MHKDALRIALAGLIQDPGPLAGWEAGIAQGLGKIPDEDVARIQLAAMLNSGGMRQAQRSEVLESIFNQLHISTTPSISHKSYARRSLALQAEMLFPLELSEAKALHEGKEDLLAKLKADLPSVFSDEQDAYLEGVLAALQRHTVNLPSSQTGVSYYDQSRITAALAVCLHKKQDAHIRALLEALEKPTSKKEDLTEPVALLVGGDISGIQDFIYTITAKGAAKSLRGRSFYLQLLTEAILRFVLRELDLPYVNVIYSGGGHFFLLALPQQVEMLKKAQRKITAALLNHHRTSLYLALGWAEVPVQDFFEGRFPEKWGEMHRALTQRKQRRYTELDEDLHKQVFQVDEHGGNPDETCSVCKEDHRKARKWDELDTQERICTLCDSFIEEIGKRLPKNDFILLAFGAPATGQMRYASDALAEFGLGVQFVEDARTALVNSAGQSVLWSLGDPENGAWPRIPGAPRWSRYTANHVPLDEDNSVLEFDKLQKLTQGGFERLGVLRMDVDNLGDLFKRGLGKQASLAQLATLSFRTSLFFEGWLKQLCEREEFQGLIYTVYAGGDDVFLIGPWERVPHLARRIVEDFARYTGGNPDVHLSAGMTFIDGKYPVYQAAEDAKEALDDAKSLPGKNAFTFLGKSWPWPDFDNVTAKYDRLDALVKPREQDKKAAPRALLQTLQQLALQEEQYKDKKVKGRHVWGRWIWMGMYQLTRMSELNKSTAAEIQSIRDELKKNNYLEIDQWGIAARWAELQERNKSKQEDPE